MAYHPFWTYFCLETVFSLTFALTLPPTVNLVPPLASNNESASFAWSLGGVLTNASDNLGESLPVPVCKGALLGTNLDRASCFQAFQSIPKSKGRREFGDRSFGSMEIPLPRRYMSGDGVCAIDIFHRDGYYRDIASFQQISQAAYRLLQACVTRRNPQYPNEGGYIRDLGQNKNLVVVLSVYAPHVACYGPSQSFTGVGEELLGMIPVSTENQSFGPSGEPGVEVPVPRKFAKARVVAPYGMEAVVDVESRGLVTGRWFDLWAGAVAINAMCVATGLAGTSSLPGGLSMTLKRIARGLESNNTAVD